MVEFVHASHLGTSVGVRECDGGVVVAMSFSHKASPSGRRNFEQFSRRKGRQIVTARANACAAGEHPPYTQIIETKEDARTVTRAIGDFLHAEIPEIVGQPVNLTYYDQINNDLIFRKVVSLAETAIRQDQ